MSSTRRIVQTGWLVLLAVVGWPALPCADAALQAAILQQQGSVSGRVVDAQTNQPLASAQVVVEGTTIGALTDQSGRFQLTGLTGPQVEVRVQLLGYRPETQAVAVGATNLEFALRETAIELNAIVVTGTPGETQARAVGNSVASVSAEDLTRVAPVASVQDVLSGRISGVNISSGSGNVGGGGVTRIRGIGTISLSSEPLIYVDGVRVNNSRSGPDGMRESAPTSRINDFNPEDIASIEVIKGPAAATLYGTEASNGVIQIITKSGQAGAAQFNFSVRQGFNFLHDIEDRTPINYFRDPATGELTEWNAVRQERELGILDGGLFTKGPVQNYSGSISGGNDRIRYFMAGDYGYEEGALDYNWNRSGGARANLDALISDEFDVGLNFGFNRGQIRYAQQLSAYGVWDAVVWGHALRQRNINGFEQRGFYTAPPEKIAVVEAYNNSDRMTGSLTANWRPYEWLSQRFTVGADVGSETNVLLIPRQLEGSSSFFGRRGLGEKELGTVRPTVTTLEYMATGTKGFGDDLELATSVGFQHYAKSISESSSYGEIFPVPAVTSVGGSAVTRGSEDFVENKTLGAFVQEQISWRNRVFLTGAVRGDDNSAFGESFDFVAYPKLSGSWVVHEEPFFNVPWVSALRLRGAWGKAGQQPDAFAAVRLYDPETGPGSVSVLTPGNIGNPDLKPEVGTELELGFDAGLFEDRVSVEFNVYNQSLTDAIVERQVAPSSGFTGTQFVNAGELVNRGVELAMNGQLITRPNFNWEIGFNNAWNENELVSLGGLPESFDLYTGVQVGYPMNGYWAVNIVSADLDATGRAINIMCEQPDGSILPCAESAPKLFIGPQTPLWQGSVTSTLGLFENLRLYANVAYAGGYYRADGDVGYAHMLMGNTRAMQGYPDGRGPDPIAIAYSTNAGSWGKALWMHDAGFARLREVSATYSVPNSIASRIGASSLSVNAAARNLWFLWRAETEIMDRLIVDPETRGRGESAGQTQTHLPPLSSILMTVRVQF